MKRASALSTASSLSALKTHSNPTWSSSCAKSPKVSMQQHSSTAAILTTANRRCVSTASRARRTNALTRRCLVQLKISGTCRKIGQRSADRLTLWATRARTRWSRRSSRRSRWCRTLSPSATLSATRSTAYWLKTRSKKHSSPRKLSDETNDK